ncbi:hypothetical protein NFJ02_11g07880 [Pycnococcus provasolii]
MVLLPGVHDGRPVRTASAPFLLNAEELRDMLAARHNTRAGLEFPPELEAATPFFSGGGLGQWRSAPNAP